MNLISDPWIPVCREDGTEVRIAPWQITEPENPVIALAAPRPDFNGALMQFLIGLLQTAVAPLDHDAWVDWLEQPPSPETLKTVFSGYTQAFDLGASGHRFMQDATVVNDDKATMISIDNLLMEVNEDHFFKPGMVSAMCPACAALGLFSLQTNAPEGGRGHFTSIRGGGPLTTLVVVDMENNDIDKVLWTNVWLNVLDSSHIASLPGDHTDRSMEAIFPWLSSDKYIKAVINKDVFPVNVNVLQHYWAMPRRIILDEPVHEVCHCDICGERTDESYRQYKTRPSGIHYADGQWKHPLSPHYVTDDGRLSPVHPQPGGLSYKSWFSLALAGDGDRERSAYVVTKFVCERILEVEQLRILAFGYDMKSKKARCWYEAVFPLIVISDDMVRGEFSKRTQSMVDAATKVAGSVQTCVKDAWFKRPGDARGDTGFLKEAFFQHTENAFYAMFVPLKIAIEQRDDSQVLSDWHSVLAREAMTLFDYWAARGDVAVSNPRRIAMAYQKLRKQIYAKKLLASLGIRQKEKAA